jgi:hypothetical protein
VALTVLTTDIPAGESVSTPLLCQGASGPPGGRVARIGMPPDRTAAPLSFQVSPDNTNYFDLHHAVQDPNGRWVPYESVVLTVIPNTLLSLPAGTGFQVNWLKLRSGTTTAPTHLRHSKHRSSPNPRHVVETFAMPPLIFLPVEKVGLTWAVTKKRKKESRSRRAALFIKAVVEAVRLADQYPMPLLNR